MCVFDHDCFTHFFAGRPRSGPHLAQGGGRGWAQLCRAALSALQAKAWQVCASDIVCRHDAVGHRPTVAACQGQLGLTVAAEL